MNATKSKLFYEEHAEKLAPFVAEQLKDGWTADDIKEYFRNLGYDYFFECEKLIPAIYLKGTKVVVVTGDLGDDDCIRPTFDLYTKEFPQQHLVAFDDRGRLNAFAAAQGWEVVL